MRSERQLTASMSSPAWSASAWLAKTMSRTSAALRSRGSSSHARSSRRIASKREISGPARIESSPRGPSALIAVMTS